MASRNSVYRDFILDLISAKCLREAKIIVIFDLLINECMSINEQMMSYSNIVYLRSQKNNIVHFYQTETYI